MIEPRCRCQILVSEPNYTGATCKRWATVSVLSTAGELYVCGAHARWLRNDPDTLAMEAIGHGNH